MQILEIDQKNEEKLTSEFFRQLHLNWLRQIVTMTKK